MLSILIVNWTKLKNDSTTLDMETKQEVLSPNIDDVAQQLSDTKLAPKNNKQHILERIFAKIDELKQQLPIVRQSLDDSKSNASYHIIYAQTYVYLHRMFEIHPSNAIKTAKHILDLAVGLYQFGELLRKSNSDKKLMIKKMGAMLCLVTSIDPQVYWDMLDDNKKEGNLGKFIQVFFSE
jgi:hypothetical protein